MTKQRPRVAVTLSDEAHKLVHQLAEIENTSASKVIASMIEDALPVLGQLVKIGSALGQLDEGKKAQLALLAQQMESGLIPKNDDLLKGWVEAMNQAQEIVTGK